MSKDYSIGYESLLRDFKYFQKQTPIGITITRKSNSIYLQFKTSNKPRRQYPCNCDFTLDGMRSALIKANKVAEALKSLIPSLSSGNGTTEKLRKRVS